ncbi:MAG: hypothetical protein VX874_07935 [Pseudomonadota bacterium]|nr:hypothetical protein [Pseudomonadota bacterium]
MKTILQAGLATLLIPSALTAGTADLVRQFATCSGRLSAQMEFQWLLGDDAADQTRRERAAMIALLDAVTHPDERRSALATRIQAKHAQNVLLTRATFNADEDDAAWAAARAEVEIGSCRALILS